MFEIKEPDLTGSHWKFLKYICKVHGLVQNHRVHVCITWWSLANHSLITKLPRTDSLFKNSLFPSNYSNGKKYIHFLECCPVDPTVVISLHITAFMGTSPWPDKVCNWGPKITKPIRRDNSSQTWSGLTLQTSSSTALEACAFFWITTMAISTDL